MIQLLSSLFGFGAMVSLFAAYQQKKRSRLILAKLCADVCWVCHYGLLGATAGMIPNFLGIFRELIFMQRGRKQWANHWGIPLFFILCGWALGLHTLDAWFHILPIAASTFVTVSLWLKKPGLTKLVTIPVCLAFLLYDLFVGSYMGIVNESLSILSILLSFGKDRLSENSAKEDFHEQ